jgi:hypothetical protein
VFEIDSVLDVRSTPERIFRSCMNREVYAYANYCSTESKRPIAASLARYHSGNHFAFLDVIINYPLRQRRTIADSTKMQNSEDTLPRPCTLLEPCRNRKSGCQRRSVSQDQICQCESHVQCRNLFGQSSVSRLSIAEQPFDNSEDVLDFCSDG